MEELPIIDAQQAELVEAYKHAMAHAIDKAARAAESCAWDDVSVADDLRLDLQPDGETGFRLVGTVRGSLEYWKRQWNDGMATQYETYECKAEESRIAEFAHEFPAFRSRYCVHGIYSGVENPDDKMFRIVYASNTQVRAQYGNRPSCLPVDGELAVWMVECEDDPTRCKLTLVCWADFHMSALSALWHFGISDPAAVVGTMLRTWVLGKQQPITA